MTNPPDPAKPDRIGMSPLADRGAVLFIGVAVGTLVGFAFCNGGALPWTASPRTIVSSPMTNQSVAASATCSDTFPLAPAVVARLRANHPLRIGVFGDSFGEGVGWAATQVLNHNAGFQIYPFAHEGTGFTRYGSLDLLADTKARLARQPIDIALISFGANDTQGVWAGGRGAAYMSKSWRKIIGARVGELLDDLKSQGVAVGWMGLPRMRDAAYDNQVQAMNAFYAGLLCRQKVLFVNPVAVSEDGAHQFAPRLTDPLTGKSYEARAQDGIHMTMHGYQVISRPLIERIEALALRDDRTPARNAQ